MFDDMLNDEIHVIKADGTRQGPFKTTIGKGKATVFDTSIDVSAGDQVERSLPGGKIEMYEVRDVDYSPGLGGFNGIPPNYKLHLEKQGLKPRMEPRAMTVHINGSSGFQVGDYNQMNVGTALAELINKIEKSPDASAKVEAKSKLKSFLEHPLVSTLLGSGASALLGKL